MTDTSQGRVFAMYLQLTKGSGETRARQQFILIAPFEAVTEFTLFHRRQSSINDRTVWRHQLLTLQTAKDFMTGRINNFSSWDWSPIVICEVAPHEMREIIATRKTPYRVLARLTKVAAKSHNLTI